MPTPVQVEALIGGLTDSSGNPLNGGKVYTYDAGTTTPKTTWQDVGKVTPHANPIILDSQGKKLVFADGSYKFRIDNSADVTQYTHDGLIFNAYSDAGSFVAATTGAPNTYVATLSPSILALTAGREITFVINATNTGASTLNVNGTGAKALVNEIGGALMAYDLLASGIYYARFSTILDSWMVLNRTPGHTPWVPGMTPQNGTASAKVYSIAEYSVSGKLVTFNMGLSWTQVTANAAYIDFTAPPFGTPFAIGAAFACWANPAGTAGPGAAVMIATAGNGTFRVYADAAAAFTVAAGKEIYVSGSYFIS